MPEKAYSPAIKGYQIESQIELGYEFEDEGLADFNFDGEEEDEV